jgi:hypothetical protein
MRITYHTKYYIALINETTVLNTKTIDWLERQFIIMSYDILILLYNLGCVRASVITVNRKVHHLCRSPGIRVYGDAGFLTKGGRGRGGGP